MASSSQQVQRSRVTPRHKDWTNDLENIDQTSAFAKRF